MKAILTCLWRLVRHKWFILVAGLRLGVPLWLLIIHDLSKLLPVELPAYARRYHGDAGDPTGYAYAFLHHQNHNPHHWECWVDQDGHPLPMPDRYVREMVADWLGAQRSKHGNWLIEEWFAEIRHSMCAHSKTKDRLRVVMGQVRRLNW